MYSAAEGGRLQRMLGGFNGYRDWTATAYMRPRECLRVLEAQVWLYFIASRQQCP